MGFLAAPIDLHFLQQLAQPELFTGLQTLQKLCPCHGLWQRLCGPDWRLARIVCVSTHISACVYFRPADSASGALSKEFSHEVRLDILGSLQTSISEALIWVRPHVSKSKQSFGGISWVNVRNSKRGGLQCMHYIYSPHADSSMELVMATVSSLAFLAEKCQAHAIIKRWGIRSFRHFLKLCWNACI